MTAPCSPAASHRGSLRSSDVCSEMRSPRSPSASQGPSAGRARARGSSFAASSRPSGRRNASTRSVAMLRSETSALRATGLYAIGSHQPQALDQQGVEAGAQQFLRQRVGARPAFVRCRGQAALDLPQRGIDLIQALVDECHRRPCRGVGSRTLAQPDGGDQHRQGHDLPGHGQRHDAPALQFEQPLALRAGQREHPARSAARRTGAARPAGQPG